MDHPWYRLNGCSWFYRTANLKVEEGKQQRERERVYVSKDDGRGYISFVGGCRRCDIVVVVVVQIFFENLVVAYSWESTFL